MLALSIASSCQANSSGSQAPVPLVTVDPIPQASDRPRASADRGETTARLETLWDGKYTRDQDGLLTVRKTGKTTFHFRLEVDGPNAHVGEVDGEATLNTSKTATFAGDNQCILSFELKRDAIEISVNEWSHCMIYHGARCHLDGRFARVKSTP